MPCLIHLRADASPVYSNEAADVILKRVESEDTSEFIHVLTQPFAHDDEPRTCYVRAAEIVAIIPMHPRDYEASLDDPPDWYAEQS